MMLGVLLVLYLIKIRGTASFEKRIVNTLIFVLSFISLVISLKVFWNIAIYVDDYGTSPTGIYGGEFWLYMAWLRLSLLAVITLLSGVKLFSK